MPDTDREMVTFSPEDEHVQIIINRNLRLCQTTMMAEINRASNKAEKAHERIDGIVDRLNVLDHPEMGKVTAMWEDRKYVRTSVRNTLVAMVIFLFLSLLAQFWSQSNVNKQINSITMKSSQAIAAEILKEETNQTRPTKQNGRRLTPPIK